MYWNPLYVLLSLAVGAACAADERAERCTPGHASAKGNFGSHATEDRAHAFLTWQAAESYYLYQIAAHRCSGCHDTALEEVLHPVVDRTLAMNPRRP